MATGAVVLAGGRSSRMGSPKAGLEWHGSTLLRRACGLAARGVDGPVVVVRAPGQALPDLPPSVEVVEDPVEGRGPLQGLATGLAALQDRVERAFVVSVDLPLLHPAFVRRVARETRGEAALPVVGGHRQPLAAAYRTALAGPARDLLARGGDRPGQLLQEVAVTVLDEAALLADARLAAADPRLDSVTGANTPEAYGALRARPAPTVRVQRLGVLAPGGRTVEVAVRAATLAAAVEAVGVRLDRHVLVALDGDQTTRDGQTPLAEGDLVTLVSADAGG